MDDYSRHEVLDRVSVVADGFSRNVLDHEWVDSLDPEDSVRLALEAAAEALADAYQAVGLVHLDGG